MSINLNFTHKSEYKMHNNLIAEAIDIYGVQCKLLITVKENVDYTVFGDWSNIKTNGSTIFDINVLPSDQADIEREYQFTDFGLNYLYNNQVFVSSKSLARLGLNLEALYSALLVFPSNQIMEITDVDFKVPGVNNLWAFSDLKSVIKLTLNSYQFKNTDNIEDKHLINTREVLSEDLESLPDDIKTDAENYKVLDGYFETLLRVKDDQDIEAEVRDCTVEVKKESKEAEKNESVKKPVVDTKERDPFGW